MKPKTYLSEIHRLKRMTQRLEHKIETLRHRAEGLKGITYDKDKVQTSPEDPMSKICAEISEIDNEIYCISICKADKIRELSNTIHNLERPEERTVLTLYFIEHIKIKEIAKRMNYTENGIYGIRRKACNNIVKYIPKEK